VLYFTRGLRSAGRAGASFHRPRACVTTLPAVTPIIAPRRATLADQPRAIDIVFNALRSYGLEPEPHGLDADVMRFGEAVDGSCELVVTVDGVVAGLSSLFPRADGLGWVSKVFVDAHFRRQGLATLLLSELMREARARGYRRLGLRTRTLFREAIALYERLGWTRGPTPEGPCDRTYFLDLA
jgi:GNAT superfamily N-acetyltransferase